MKPETRAAIRLMRVYSAHGAKALAPLLDAHKPPRTAWQCEERMRDCRALAESRDDAPAMEVLARLSTLHWKQVRVVHAAYWELGWEIGSDGEPRKSRPTPEGCTHEAWREALKDPRTLCPLCRLMFPSLDAVEAHIDVCAGRPVTPAPAVG